MNNLEQLLSKTYTIIDCASKITATKPAWSLGGGTAMMLAYHHRKPRGIDIFMRDAQCLSACSPRLNDAAKAFCDDYDEQSNCIKISTEEGDIKFILSARKTKRPVKSVSMLGRDILIETPREVVVKKLLFRAAGFQIIDIFDTACLLQKEPGKLFSELDLFRSRLAVLKERVLSMQDSYQNDARKIIIDPSSEFVSLLDNGADVVLRFINDC